MHVIISMTADNVIVCLLFVFINKAFPIYKFPSPQEDNILSTSITYNSMIFKTWKTCKQQIIVYLYCKLPIIRDLKRENNPCNINKSMIGLE